MSTCKNGNTDVSVVYGAQLFYLKLGGVLVFIITKLVDDILVGGGDDIRKRFIYRLSEVYKVGTIVHLPGVFRFFGLTVEQDEDATVHISADDKLQAIESHNLTRLRRKEQTSSLNAVELFSFQSVNGSLGFLGMKVSPYDSFSSSHLQQLASCPSVRVLVHQRNMLNHVKRMGSVSSFRRPSTPGTYDVSVVFFDDAARPSTSGQLGFVGGLLLGSFKHGSVLHTITWASYLSKRPVKSIGFAEVLATGEAIDEGKLVTGIYKTLLSSNMDLYVCVDSKDLFSSLSTCRTPEDKSIRADVQLLRYNFQTPQVNQVIWIPGRTNPADPLRKLESPLMDSLQVMMFDGTLPLHCDKIKMRSFVASLA